MASWMQPYPSFLPHVPIVHRHNWMKDLQTQSTPPVLSFPSCYNSYMNPHTDDPFDPLIKVTPKLTCVLQLFHCNDQHLSKTPINTILETLINPLASNATFLHLDLGCIHCEDTRVYNIYRKRQPPKTLPFVYSTTFTSGILDSDLLRTSFLWQILGMPILVMDHITCNSHHSTSCIKAFATKIVPTLLITLHCSVCTRAPRRISHQGRDFVPHMLLLALLT